MDLGSLTKDLHLASTSRAEVLAGRLEAAIVTAALPPGYHFGTKADLRKETGVAAGTLNEALRVLQIRGLVEVRSGPGGGVFVASRVGAVELHGAVLRLRREARTFAECLVVRNMLDPLVAMDAARSCTAQDTTDLHTKLGEMAAASGDPRRSLALNWELHRRIAEIGSNAALAAISISLLDFMAEAAADVERSTSQDADDTFRVHAELVEAIASGDVDRARVAAERHGAHRQPADVAPGSQIRPDGVAGSSPVDGVATI